MIMTSIMKLWQSHTENEQAAWSDVLESKLSLAEIRRELKTRFNLDLQYDWQVRRLRSWVASQVAIQAQATYTAAEAEEWAKQAGPDVDLDLEILRRAKIHAFANNDYKLGLEAMELTVEWQQLNLERKEFEQAGRTDNQVALDCMLKRYESKPESLAAAKKFANIIDPEHYPLNQKTPASSTTPTVTPKNNQ